eukprot:3660-Heterococcus_DN1.PRE.2
MLRASFTNQNKLHSLDMTFDALAFLTALRAASPSLQQHPTTNNSTTNTNNNSSSSNNSNDMDCSGSGNDTATVLAPGLHHHARHVLDEVMEAVQCRRAASACFSSGVVEGSGGATTKSYLRVFPLSCEGPHTTHFMGVLQVVPDNTSSAGMSSSMGGLPAVVTGSSDGNASTSSGSGGNSGGNSSGSGSGRHS